MFAETIAQIVSINVQWTRFSNLLAWNNPRLVDMLLESINQSDLTKFVVTGVKRS